MDRLDSKEVVFLSQSLNNGSWWRWTQLFVYLVWRCASMLEGHIFRWVGSRSSLVLCWLTIARRNTYYSKKKNYYSEKKKTFSRKKENWAQREEKLRLARKTQYRKKNKTYNRAVPESVSHGLKDPFFYLLNPPKILK